MSQTQNDRAGANDTSPGAISAAAVNGGNPSNPPCVRCDHSLYYHTNHIIVDGGVIERDFCRKSGCRCPGYLRTRLEVTA